MHSDERLLSLEKLLALPATDLTGSLDDAAAIIGEVFSAEKVDAWLHDPSDGQLVVAGYSRTALSRKEIALGVEAQQRPDGQWAVVSLHDQGIGIPAADPPRIFERFHRASNVSRSISGTGLGLASAQHIVVLHGGRIEVETHEGRGSTFSAYLPL
jgi:nitrogen-specific signal transduction histidine kinase